jgi:hypothetical protein
VTFLVYLNAAYEGGETVFPLIGLRHRGDSGDALYLPISIHRARRIDNSSRRARSDQEREMVAVTVDSGSL